MGFVSVLSALLGDPGKSLAPTQRVCSSGNALRVAEVMLGRQTSPLDSLSARAVVDLLRLPSTDIAKQNLELLSDMHRRGLLEVIDRPGFELRLADLREAEREFDRWARNPLHAQLTAAPTVSCDRVGQRKLSLGVPRLISAALERIFRSRRSLKVSAVSAEHRAYQRRWFAAEAIKNFTVSEIGYIRTSNVAKRLLEELARTLQQNSKLKNLAELDARQPK